MALQEVGPTLTCGSNSFSSHWIFAAALIGHVARYLERIQLVASQQDCHVCKHKARVRDSEVPMTCRMRMGGAICCTLIGGASNSPRETKQRRDTDHANVFNRRRQRVKYNRNKYKYTDSMAQSPMSLGGQPLNGLLSHRAVPVIEPACQAGSWLDATIR